MNNSLLYGMLTGAFLNNREEAREEEGLSLDNINIDRLIELTKEAKIAQTPEKYILDEDEKNKILSDLKNAGVDEEVIDTIKTMIEGVVFKRYVIVDLVNELLKK